MRQEQTVAALQQQAARGLIESPGTYKGVVPKDDTFTVSSLRSEYGPEIQIVAKIDYRTDRHMVTLLFRGERIGYSIDENIFGAMLKNKQVVSIGEQYAVMSGEQMNLIKGMVISGSNKKSSRIQANGNLVETVSY
jgi:hypothetical protein